MQAIEMFICPLFNYFTDIQPAKNDPMEEQRMVNVACSQPNNRFSREELSTAIHNLVHGKHYMVSEGPATVS